MVRTQKPFFLFVFFLILISAIYIIKKHYTYNSPDSSVTTSAQKQRPTHAVKFYDEKTFTEGINKAGSSLRTQDYSIRGGIVPHHLYPGFIIADFFNRLAIQNPATIILLGPNHYERGNFKALTSLYNWNTPFGRVDADEVLIHTLKARNLVQVDEETLPHDHSLSGMMPFIKYYMPDAKVVPILLKHGFSQGESEILAENLSTLLKKNMVVIAPVDFSHYLTSNHAKEKDEITLHAMREFDYKKLYSFNNDYLDSPPSIGTLLMIMQKINATKTDILFHTNSGEMQNNNYIDTTSYFSIIYY